MRLQGTIKSGILLVAIAGGLAWLPSARATAVVGGNCPTNHNQDNADLHGENLSGCNLSGFNFNHSNLSDCNLSGANLSGANLNHSNLSGANLSNANCSGANLDHSDLSGANLTGANFKGANLDHANLGGGACGGELTDANTGDSTGCANPNACTLPSCGGEGGGGHPE